eukprot:428736_1
MSYPSRLPQLTVIGWLTEVVKLPQYKKNLIKNGFDTFQIVQYIKKKSQLTEIGITKIGHQTQLLQAINNLEKPTIPSYSPLNKFYNPSYPPISMNNSNINKLFPPPIVNTYGITQQHSTINTNGLTSVSLFPTQICSNISPSNIS